MADDPIRAGTQRPYIVGALVQRTTHARTTTGYRASLVFATSEAEAVGLWTAQVRTDNAGFDVFEAGAVLLSDEKCALIAALSADRAAPGGSGEERPRLRPRHVLRSIIAVNGLEWPELVEPAKRELAAWDALEGVSPPPVEPAAAPVGGVGELLDAYIAARDLANRTNKDSDDTAAAEARQRILAALRASQAPDAGWRPTITVVENRSDPSWRVEIDGFVLTEDFESGASALRWAKALEEHIAAPPSPQAGEG